MMLWQIDYDTSRHAISLEEVTPFTGNVREFDSDEYKEKRLYREVYIFRRLNVMLLDEINIKHCRVCL